MTSLDCPDDEPFRWAGSWEPSPYPFNQVERDTMLPVQIQNRLTARSVDHSQSGVFDPGAREEFGWQLAHAQDVRPNAMTILLQWRAFLPGSPKLAQAINIQRALEATMYFPTDFREWPVVCRLMGTGIPRADPGRKQRCEPQIVFSADDRLWSYRIRDQHHRELTCLI